MTSPLLDSTNNKKEVKSRIKFRKDKCKLYHNRHSGSSLKHLGIRKIFRCTVNIEGILNKYNVKENSYETLNTLCLMKIQKFSVN